MTIIFSITRQASECAIIDFLEDSSDEVFHSTKDTSPLRFSDCVWRNLEPFHDLSFLSPFYLMFVEITVVKYLTWTVENATTLICLILCIKTVFK